MKVIAQTPDALGCTFGPWTLWSLSDGYVDLPVASLKDPDELAKASQTPGATVRLSVNAFLLQHPGRDTMLVDCGAGGSWDDTMGHLGRALAAAGADADEIRVLLVTHAHNDHVNGLLSRDGQDAFPNLDRILIPAGARAMFEGDAGLARFRLRLVSIDGGTELVPGLRTVSLPGHAAGHTGYLLSAGDETVLICGDIIHVPARQFARPELTWAADEEPARALATRLEVLNEAAATGMWLAGAHLGRPGLGQVRREGAAFQFAAAVQWSAPNG